MDIQIKFLFAGLIIVLDFFLLLPQYLYRRNKKEWDRRYWGKNRTWLRDNRTMSTISAVILTVYMIAILLDK
jgi:hypothetical protein